MANTIWNNSDKTANITLSGTPLVVATQTGTGLLGGVRAVDKQINAKIYWEGTFTTAPGINTTIGLGTIAAPTGNPPTQSAVNSGPYSLGIASGTSGSIYRQGSALINNVGAFSGAGTLIGIAVDSTLVVPQAWFRVGAAGNWNGNANYSPVTGIGGIALWGSGIPIFPMVWSGGQNDAITANFGDSAFTGVVPAGYTSGFTAGAVIAVNDVVSQVGTEVWAATNPDMRLTQAGVEVWATPSGGTTQMNLTQIGLEVWARIPSAIVPQARAIIMA